MRELADTVEAMTVEVKGLRGDLREVAATLRREQFWRRVSAVLAVAGFLSVLVFVSFSRQADCDRNNVAREQTRAANVAAWATAWDELAIDRGDRQVLLDEIAADQERILPARDCEWPT